MLNYLIEQKPKIKRELKDFLKEKEREFSSVNPWGKDLLQRLCSFADRGKMIRGGLILLSHRMAKGEDSRAALDAAVAIELIHAAFLIHDDIMDHDIIRRGEKTVFYQYQEIGKARGFPRAEDFGRAMGICAGDITFFLAYDLLKRLDTAPETRCKIFEKITREMNMVGLAQMQDVYFGFASPHVSEEEVLSVFRYKTARYTFSLPLYLGAVLAGKEEEALEVLEEIGENLGIIFQIKDDELGLYGDENMIGKPLGSDIKGAKKTLYYLFLMEKGGAADRQRLENIFGNSNITAGDIEYVKETIEQLGIREQVQKKVEALAARTCGLIESLEESQKNQRILMELLEYSLRRNC